MHTRNNPNTNYIIASIGRINQETLSVKRILDAFCSETQPRRPSYLDHMLTDKQNERGRVY